MPLPFKTADVLLRDLPDAEARGIAALFARQLTHEELSNLIGTTRETVTILLHKFEEMGIIRRQARQIIVDRPRLAEYAHIAEI